MIAARVLAQFPARVSGADGVAVEKENGAFTVKQDWGALAEDLALPNTADTYFGIWKQSGDTYTRISADTLLPYVASGIVTLNITRAQIATTKIPLNSFAVAGFATAGDLGAGALYMRGTSSGPMAVQDASGQWFELTLPGFANVRHFGAKGDGDANDTAAFAAAFAASNHVYVPNGVYLAQIELHNRQKLIGQDKWRTVIKTPPGATRTAIFSVDAYSLFSSAPGWDTNELGSNDIEIAHLTVDGNAANISVSGDGIAIWGRRPNIHDVNIFNCKTDGLHTEHTESPVSMEPEFRNLRIEKSGRHGWWFSGPHDAHSSNIMIISSSQAADRGGYGLRIGESAAGAAGNGRFFNVHCWNYSQNSNRPEYQLLSSGYNEFMACHFEGGRQSVHCIGGGTDRFVGCSIYSVFGSNGAALVDLDSNSNLFLGCYFNLLPSAFLGGDWDTPNPDSAVNTNPDAYAINFKATSGNKVIDCHTDNFKLRTPFNFGASSGLNVVRGRAYCASGGITTFGGSVNANDEIDYVQDGTFINYRKPRSYFAASNDAGAASGGVPIGGMYQNSSTGALTQRVT